jgi:hypothetical protein
MQHFTWFDLSNRGLRRCSRQFREKIDQRLDGDAGAGKAGDTMHRLFIESDDRSQ